MKRFPSFPLSPVLVGVWLSALFQSSGLGAPGGGNSLPVGLFASEWEAIRSDVDAGRHRFEVLDDGTPVVRNPGQQWHTVFDGEGFLTRPDAGGWEWGLSLRSVTSGDVRRSLSKVIARKTVNGNRLDLCRGAGLTEWFVNDGRGLEQGWTFAYAPEPGAATIRLELAVRGGLRPEVAERAVAFRNEAGAAVLTYG
ncbi:MAG: hypothetical protein KDM63_18635, partial [Verrucomicrobiae bacterium]|nr:hypothetical protein [Verrucomicrobiae bacterium]